MKISVILSIVLLPFLSCAQYADSLLNVLGNQKHQKAWKAAAETEYKLGKYYYNAYEDSLCELHLTKSITYAQKAHDTLRQAAATNFLGNLMGAVGKHDESQKLYLKAVDLTVNNDTLRASFMNNLGLAYENTGQYKKAIEVLYEALELKEKIGASKKSISSTLLNLGLTWDLLGEPEKSLEFYNRSLAIKKELGDSLGISRLLSNMAVIVKNQGKLKKALKLIVESNAYNQTPQDYNQFYTNHVNQGNIYKKLGMPDLFIAHFDSAYYYAKEINNTAFISDIHQNLGTFYFEQKDFQRAIDHLNKALEIPGEDVTNVLLYENHKHLSLAYAAISDYNKAYFHLNKSNLYRDSIFSVEKQKAIQDVREKYETEKKEKDLAIKELELSEAQSETRRKTVIILYLVGGIVIITLIGFIAFRQYRDKQRHKLLLAQQRLEKSREEIDKLRDSIESHLEQKPAVLNISISQEEINQYLIDPLSEREIEVLMEIANGKTNKEVAEAIFVSENTVKFHLKNIYLKLDVKNRTEAITKADSLNVWRNN